MTWTPLLLADPSPCLRLLVLRELLHKPEEDPEVHELAVLRQADPLVTDLLALQNPDGSWKAGDLGSKISASSVLLTAHALMRLGYLGFGPDDPAVKCGAEYLFSMQQADGSWPLPDGRDENEEHEGYSMMPLQAALPLRGLAACGYATNRRAEWALQLAVGATPTGRRLADRDSIGRLWLCRRLSTAGAFALGLPLEHHRRAALPGAAPRAAQ